jgi:hypothetical protein
MSERILSPLTEKDYEVRASKDRKSSSTLFGAEKGGRFFSYQDLDIGPNVTLLGVLLQDGATEILSQCTLPLHGFLLSCYLAS